MTVFWSVWTCISFPHWLAEKAKEEGVMPLPKGIYYKVMAAAIAAYEGTSPNGLVVRSIRRVSSSRRR